MSLKTIKAADLFCGAGGTSTGLIEANAVPKNLAKELVKAALTQQSA